MWLEHVALACKPYFRSLDFPKEIMRTILCLSGCRVVIELAQMLMESRQAM